MLESAWLLLGVMAFVWTVLNVLVSSIVSAETYDFVIIASTAGMIMWGVWVFAALSGVEVAGDTTVHTFNMAPVALVGLVMVLPNIYLALIGPIEILDRVNDTGVRDV